MIVCCRACRQDIPLGAHFCPHCRAPVRTAPAAPSQPSPTTWPAGGPAQVGHPPQSSHLTAGAAPGAQAQPQVPWYPPVQQFTPVSGKATASMILGILSIPSCVCYGLPGILLGPLALVLGVLAREEVDSGEYRGHSHRMAGMICGAIGTLIPLSLLAMFILMAIANSI